MKNHRHTYKSLAVEQELSELTEDTPLLASSPSRTNLYHQIVRFLLRDPFVFRYVAWFLTRYLGPKSGKVLHLHGASFPIENGYVSKSVSRNNSFESFGLSREEFMAYLTNNPDWVTTVLASELRDLSKAHPKMQAWDVMENYIKLLDKNIDLFLKSKIITVIERIKSRNISIWQFDPRDNSIELCSNLIRQASSQNGETLHYSLINGYLEEITFNDVANQTVKLFLATDTEFSRKLVIPLHFFMRGWDYFFNRVWPFIFYNLLIHDLIQYTAHPQERYGDTLGNIFAGSSQNQLIFTSQLGSELPFTSAYWAPVILFSLSPLVLGLANLTRRYPLYKKLWQLDKIDLAELPEAHYQKILAALNPFSQFSEKLAALEYMLTWRGGFTMQKRAEMVETFIQTCADQSGLVKMRFLQVLANIADGFHEKDIAHFSQEDKKIVYKMQQDIVVLLKESGLFGRYLLWSLGQSLPMTRLKAATLTGLVFIPIVFAKFYAVARWFEMNLNKIIGYANYAQAKKSCEAQDKIFQYSDLIADMVCAICPDWPVPFQEINSSQACLNYFLVKPRSAEQVINALERVFKHPNLSMVDLSKQAWSTWSLAEVEAVFTTIEQGFGSQSAFNNTGLNLSNANNFPEDLTNGLLARINQLLNRVILRSFIFNNNGLDDFYGQLLINEGIRNQTALEFLSLAKNNLGGQTAQKLIRYLPDTNLKYLNINSNNFNDLSLSKITEVIPVSLTNLSIAMNNAGQGTINTITKLSQLYFLDISQNNLQSLNMTGFNYLWKYGRLDNLLIKKASLSQNDLISLFSSVSQSSLSQLDVSDNFFENNGFYTFINLFKDSNLRSINLKNLGLRDQDVISMAKAIDSSLIKKIDLSNNIISDNGLFSFSQIITPNSIKELDLSNNDLSANNVVGLLSLIQHSSLRSLGLANTNLAVENSNDLVTAISNSSLNYINLDNNQLSADFLFNLAKVLASSSLAELSANNIGASVSGVVAVTQALSKTNITLFSASKTISAINQEDAANIARALIATDNPEEFNNPTPSLDFRRWLYQHGKRKTALQSLSLAEDQLDVNALSILCRATSMAGIEAANFSGNSQNYNSINCQSVSSSQYEFKTQARNEASKMVATASIPVLGTFLLLFLIANLVYQRYFAKKTHQVDEESAHQSYSRI